MEQILELNEKLFGIFGFVRDAVEGLGELALQRQNHAKLVTFLPVSLHMLAHLNTVSDVVCTYECMDDMVSKPAEAVTQRGSSSSEMRVT